MRSQAFDFAVQRVDPARGEGWVIPKGFAQRGNRDGDERASRSTSRPTVPMTWQRCALQSWVVPGWSPTPGIFPAVYPTRRGMVPAVRTFLDFLGQSIYAEGLPLIARWSRWLHRCDAVHAAARARQRVLYALNAATRP